MDEPHKRRLSWLISNIFSLILLIILLYIWYTVHHYAYLPTYPQLTSSEQVQEYLANTWNKQYTQSKPVLISTGILLNTLSLDTPNELFVTGYIWQHFPYNLPKGIKQKFFLPDQIGLYKQEVIYHHVYPTEEVIETSFEALIRQKFDYRKYPFDDKVAQIVILPWQFNENIVLVPNFDSYKTDDASHDTIGIDPDIILNDFHITKTYFGYNHTNYNTDFGIPNLITQRGYPMLYFGVVLKRSLFGAIIAHVLPLVIVFIFLFAVLMMNTEHKDRFIKYNFTGTMSISACSALFFVLVLVHTSLRNQIYSDQVVYIEYLYFLAYLLLAVVVFNNYILLTDIKKI